MENLARSTIGSCLLLTVLAAGTLFVQLGRLPLHHRDPFDRLLATRYGAYAAELIAQKKFGHMVSWQPPDITSVPIESAIDKLRLVEPDGELVKMAEGIGVSFGR